MKPEVRERFARRFKRLLAHRVFLRFHMGLILSATTFAGVGSSRLLLELGLASVRIRYPLAVVCSYLVFLGLTRLWIAYLLRGRNRRQEQGFLWGFDLSNIGIPNWTPGGGASSAPAGFQGFGGGSAGGAGASDSWGSASVLPAPSGAGGGSWLPDLSLDIDGDEVWILLLLIILVAVICGGGGYLIWMAPNILPDLALNALLAGYVSRAAKKAESQGWILGALRATVIPFFLVLLVAAGLAFAIHSACPQATRLLEALSCPDLP